MKRVCVVTGSRAEYGLLKPVIDRIDKDIELELYLVVTGAHLTSDFGHTYEEIEKDGYVIKKKIEMLLSSDTPCGIAKSMGVEMIGFADVLADNSPDMLVILGDRYEMMVAAIAAMIYKIPIAHIHGGETTEGALDEAIRHSITKMSYLHFASTETYRKRIIQLGEDPQRVFCVGALGIENIEKLKLLDKKELEDNIGFEFTQYTMMVTFHPVTLDMAGSIEQIKNLLEVLRRKKEFKIIFTRANADANGQIINRIIDNFVEENVDRSIVYASLGQVRYLSALRYCCMVVGNSSSGIIEAPSFHIPTIDIGDRQKGRELAGSIIHCETDEKKSEAKRS